MAKDPYEKRDENVSQWARFVFLVLIGTSRTDVAVGQFDMTARRWGTSSSPRSIIQHRIGLAAFNKEFVDLYLDIPWIKCGYACSDQ